MRNIKYRATSIHGKEWQHGDLASSADKKRFAILVNNKESYDECEVASETVSQFTSLYDVSGKEISEGDIVEWEKDGLMYVVRFWCGMFFASVQECNEGILGGFPLHALTEYEYRKCKIVGNIFDNSELLKGGNK